MCVCVCVIKYVLLCMKNDDAEFYIRKYISFKIFYLYILKYEHSVYMHSHKPEDGIKYHFKCVCWELNSEPLGRAPSALNY